jgi:hypothetical protein
MTETRTPTLISPLYVCSETVPKTNHLARYAMSMLKCGILMASSGRKIGNASSRTGIAITKSKCSRSRSRVDDEPSLGQRSVTKSTKWIRENRAHRKFDALRHATKTQHADFRFLECVPSLCPLVIVHANTYFCVVGQTCVLYNTHVARCTIVGEKENVEVRKYGDSERRLQDCRALALESTVSTFVNDVPIAWYHTAQAIKGGIG